MRAKSLVFDVYDMCYVEASLKANSLISFTLSKALVSLYYYYFFVSCCQPLYSIQVSQWGKANVSRISLSVVEGDKNIHLKERGGKVVAKLIGQVKLLRIVFPTRHRKGTSTSILSY